MIKLTEIPPVESRKNTKFSNKQVYMMLKEFVYPPCSKHPDNIRMHHLLASELGYEDDSRQLLAGKTNGVFTLQSPNKFTGSEMMNIKSVRDHFNSVKKKLNNANRMQQ